MLVDTVRNEMEQVASELAPKLAQECLPVTQARARAIAEYCVMPGDLERMRALTAALLAVMNSALRD